MLGTLDVTADGRFALRFERRFAHSQAKVWRAITETDQLRGWFVEILDYDRSRLDFTDAAKLTYVPKAEHQLPTGHGQVTRIDPPYLLEYTWDAETLRWELETVEDGACRLVFTNIFDDRASAVAVAPGWHAGLDSLTALLDGRQSDRSAWKHLQDDYARALG
jgi:uncharacterized protein YndB with AHSA1/START domain